MHFGHLKRKWNPNMAPYIFAEKKGIHIIDLNKTAARIEEAANAMRALERQRQGCSSWPPRSRPRTSWPRR